MSAVASVATETVASVRSIPALVFECTLAGTLDQGAAKLASLGFDARPGLGAGPSGNSYAIPTANSQGRPLAVDVVRSYVLDFFKYATDRPTEQFRITLIGQNLGPTDRELIVPLFRSAPANCLLPGTWLDRFGRMKLTRLLVGAGATSLTQPEVAQDFAEFLRMSAPLWSAGPVELISLGPAGATVAVDRFAKAEGYRHRVLPVDEQRFGLHSALARDELALWYCTRVVSLTRADETSPGHEMRLIAGAARAGIPMEEVYGY
jgi:hypothetical protein